MTRSNQLFVFMGIGERASLGVGEDIMARATFEMVRGGLIWSHASTSTIEGHSVVVATQPLKKTLQNKAKNEHFPEPRSQVAVCSGKQSVLYGCAWSSVCAPSDRRLVPLGRSCA